MNSRVKNDYKDFSIAQILASRKISFKKLAKGTFFFTFGPSLVIFTMMNLGFLPLKPALFALAFIFLSSLVFLQPYIADIQELTNYVKKLANNESPQYPKLSFINNVDELAEAIENLNKSWVEKSNNLNDLILEDRRKQNLIKDFVANASHEMKTPLASINGFTETLLEQQNDPETIKEFLNIIREQGERLTKLVNDMLTLSVAESGISWSKLKNL
jgi:signal transduction histidine kinase